MKVWALADTPLRTSPLRCSAAPWPPSLAPCASFSQLRRCLTKLLEPLKGLFKDSIETLRLFCLCTKGFKRAQRGLREGSGTPTCRDTLEQPASTPSQSNFRPRCLGALKSFRICWRIWMNMIEWIRSKNFKAKSPADLCHALDSCAVPPSKKENASLLKQGLCGLHWMRRWGSPITAYKAKLWAQVLNPSERGKATSKTLCLNQINT